MYRKPCSIHEATACMNESDAKCDRLIPEHERYRQTHQTPSPHPFGRCDDWGLRMGRALGIEEILM